MSAGENPEFIELDMQIKGKANRLPGFEPGKVGKDVKLDEVRLIIEFLKSLGYKPSKIHAMKDLAPAIEAAEDVDVDLFVPPVTGQRNQAPVTDVAASLARFASESPFMPMTAEQLLKQSISFNLLKAQAIITSRRI